MVLCILTSDFPFTLLNRSNSVINQSRLLKSILSRLMSFYSHILFKAKQKAAPTFAETAFALSVYVILIMPPMQLYSEFVLHLQHQFFRHRLRLPPWCF